MVDTVSVFRLELLCVPCIDCAFTPQKSRQPVPFASSPCLWSDARRMRTDGPFTRIAMSERSVPAS